MGFNSAFKGLDVYTSSFSLHMNITTSQSSIDLQVVMTISHIIDVQSWEQERDSQRVESWTAKEDFYPVPNFSIKLSHYTILIL
jgi:hypothetical protein